MKHAIYDENMQVVNVILWDGESEYPLEKGYSIARVEDDFAIEIGDEITVGEE